MKKNISSTISSQQRGAEQNAGEQNKCNAAMENFLKNLSFGVDVKLCFQPHTYKINTQRKLCDKIGQ